MQVMCDLNVLAFQTDTTRVSTYIGSTPNGASYPELGFNDQHHSNTHHNNDPEKVRKIARITEFNIAQFAYMVKKMHSLREGDGTLAGQLHHDVGIRARGWEQAYSRKPPLRDCRQRRRFDQNGTFLPGYEGKSGRSADHAARLRRHSDRPPRWDRDEANRGNQGLGINRQLT